MIGMCWQAVFALGLGFSNSKGSHCLWHIHALTSSDGITLDVLRGFQGMGAAAAIPAAVRCIAFVIPDKRDPHLAASFQLGTLAHSFPPSRARSIAFATFAAGAPMGGVFGNIIGGVLTQLSRCVRSFHKRRVA